MGLDSLRKWGPWTRGGWWRGGTVGGGEHTYTRTLWCAAPLCPRPPPAGLLSLAYASFQVSDAHDANMKTREPVITRSPPHTPTAPAPTRSAWPPAAAASELTAAGGNGGKSKELRKSGSRDGSGTHSGSGDNGKRCWRHGGKQSAAWRRDLGWVAVPRKSVAGPRPVHP